LLPFVKQKNGVLRSEWGAGTGPKLHPFAEGSRRASGKQRS
jgi:hypothetical protein